MGRGSGPGITSFGLLPVLLDARRAQAGEPVLVDGILPGEEFLDGQRIAAAGFLERKQSAAHGGDHLGLAPNDPALGAWCRQISDRQRAAVRSDHVFAPWSQGLGPMNQLTHSTDQLEAKTTRGGLKFA